MKTLKAVIAYFSHSVLARTLLRKHDDQNASPLPAIQKIGKTRFGTYWLAANSVKECLPRIQELVQAKEIKFKVCKHAVKQYTGSITHIPYSKRVSSQSFQMSSPRNISNFTLFCFNMFGSSNLLFAPYGHLKRRMPLHQMSSYFSQPVQRHSRNFLNKILRRREYWEHWQIQLWTSSMIVMMNSLPTISTSVHLHLIHVL